MPPGRFANYIIHRAEAQTPKYSNELQRASTVRSGGIWGCLPTRFPAVEAVSKPFGLRPSPLKGLGGFAAVAVSACGAAKGPASIRKKPRPQLRPWLFGEKKE